MASGMFHWRLWHFNGFYGVSLASRSFCWLPGNVLWPQLLLGDFYGFREVQWLLVGSMTSGIGSMTSIVFNGFWKIQWLLKSSMAVGRFPRLLEGSVASGRFNGFWEVQWLLEGINGFYVVQWIQWGFYYFLVISDWKVQNQVFTFMKIATEVFNYLNHKVPISVIEYFVKSLWNFWCKYKFSYMIFTTLS